MTIRAALAKEGVPIAGLRPSTPLEPFARVNLKGLITASGRLAPGAMPVPIVTESDAVGYVMCLWLASVIAWLVGLPILGVICALVCLVAVFVLECIGPQPLKSVGSTA